MPHLCWFVVKHKELGKLTLIGGKRRRRRLETYDEAARS